MNRHDKRFPDLGRLATSLLFLFLGVSCLASVAVFFRKHLATLSAVTVSTMAAYALLVVGGLVLIVRRPAPRRDTRFILVVALLTLVAKMALVIVCRDYPQTVDRLYFSRFVDEWVSNGFSDGTLHQLSRIYDYYLYSIRAWPLFVLLRAAFPSHFILATQIVNGLLSTLILVMVYPVARCVLTPRGSRVAMWLTAWSPVHFWMVLDYSYQFQGALLLMLCILCVLWAVRYARRIGRLLCVSVGLGLCLCALSLQAGLDLVVIAVIVATLLYGACLRRPARETVRLAVMLLVVPLLISVPPSRYAKKWFEERDAHKLGSHLIHHMALGWNTETMGEHYDPYLQIDRATPQPLKKGTMRRLILTQVRCNPVETLAVLPPVKIIKFHQVGAATGMRQAFRSAGMNGWADVFRGTRLLYAPLLLALGCWGALGFVRPPRCREKAVLVFTAVGTCLAYTFFSEVSPRYSLYVHFVLAIVAAQGLLVLLRGRNRGVTPTIKALRGGAPYLLSFAALYAVVAVCIWAGVRALPEPVFFTDARSWAYEGSHAGSEDDGAREGSRTLQPFEGEFFWPGDEARAGGFVQATRAFRVAPAGRHELSFHVWPRQAPEVVSGLVCRVTVDGELAVERSLSLLAAGERLAVSVDVEEREEVEVAVRLEALTSMILSGERGQAVPLLAWGYVSLRPGSP